jgi:hypothetical protein
MLQAHLRVRPRPVRGHTDLHLPDVACGRVHDLAHQQGSAVRKDVGRCDGGGTDGMGRWRVVQVRLQAACLPMRLAGRQAAGGDVPAPGLLQPSPPPAKVCVVHGPSGDGAVRRLGATNLLLPPPPTPPSPPPPPPPPTTTTPLLVPVPVPVPVPMVSAEPAAVWGGVVPLVQEVMGRRPELGLPEPMWKSSHVPSGARCAVGLCAKGGSTCSSGWVDGWMGE